MHKDGDWQSGCQSPSVLLGTNYFFVPHPQPRFSSCLWSWGLVSWHFSLIFLSSFVSQPEVLLSHFWSFISRNTFCYGETCRLGVSQLPRQNRRATSAHSSLCRGGRLVIYGAMCALVYYSSALGEMVMLWSPCSRAWARCMPTSPSPAMIIFIIYSLRKGTKKTLT